MNAPLFSCLHFCFSAPGIPPGTLDSSLAYHAFYYTPCGFSVNAENRQTFCPFPVRFLSICMFMQIFCKLYNFMQSYCIYAEAFAGPFRPLRAPEPPFTHKTPPFTQVLFLFDAFYGTISSRKPSSLCSYKTESEAPMKKRILALLLAFSMMLSLLPVSALADTGGGYRFRRLCE